jgi:serine/threonine protein kinase
MQSIFSSVTKQIQQLASPTVTKHYKLEGTIGKGNFSIVKRATDRETGQEVAVKVINLDKFKNNEKVLFGSWMKKMSCDLTKMCDVSGQDSN